MRYTGEWGPGPGCGPLCPSWSLQSFFSFPDCVSVSVSPSLSSGSPGPPPRCSLLGRPLPSPHELCPLPFPLATPSSRCWPWSLRNVNWPPARPATGREPGPGWVHPWPVTSAPLIPSMRTSQPLPSRWAPRLPWARIAREGAGGRWGVPSLASLFLPGPLREASLLLQPRAGQSGEP